MAKKKTSQLIAAKVESEPFLYKGEVEIHSSSRYGIYLKFPDGDALEPILPEGTYRAEIIIHKLRF